jgi:hypothetical protein
MKWFPKVFRILNSRPLKTHFEGLKIKNRALLIFVWIEKPVKNLSQQNKWVYFPLVEHSFEVHASCGQHDIDVIALDSFVKVTA